MNTFWRPNHAVLQQGYYQYADSLEPDVWFDAAVVWEVMAADLSISPVHKAAAGLVDEVRGISLRFPRYLRTRDDKQPDQCTNAAQIADMYQNQASVTCWPLCYVNVCLLTLTLPTGLCCKF